MTPEHLQELLARARATSEAARDEKLRKEYDKFSISLQEQSPTEIDFSTAGISDASLQDPSTKDAAEDAAVDVIRDSIENLVGDSRHGGKEIGVARNVTLNTKQQFFNDELQAGKSIVLIGPAGTGKTTGVGASTKNLIASGRIKPLTTSTKWLCVGKPGAAILSYTRKAVNNIKHAVADELKAHTLTIHKILEFQPIFYEIEDPSDPGKIKKTMRFEPTRDATNPLPPELVFVAFEESSMISVDLYHLLLAALPHEHQEVFLGDIQQLPPIFGSAILGFKMNELPVVELTEVYRQALQSPIISLAHKVLGGNPHDFSPINEEVTAEHPSTGKMVTRKVWPALAALCSSGEHGVVKIQPWQKKLSSDMALLVATKQFTQWIEDGYYDPNEDIILCPFNKAFGTIELNKGISGYLGRKRSALVYEVIAGYNKHYLAVGDRVLYDKEDAYIVDIQTNGNYLGKAALPPSINMDREGHLTAAMTDTEKLHAQAESEKEFSLEAIEEHMSRHSIGDERVNAASHIVTIQLAHEEEGQTIPLDDAAEINNLLGGYALTVHKFQGSENDKIFFLLHNSHATMVSRELLYTGLTRPKKFLHIICEGDTFYKGVQSQRIKGNTLAEKAEFFKGKSDEYEEKKQAVLGQAVGEYVPGVYKGEKAATAVAEIEKQAAKVELIKIDTLVPSWIKQMAGDRLENYWKRACEIWGKDIGEVPVLSFKLQASNKLGTASLRNGVIKLNAVWCCLAAKNEEVWHEMLVTTLVHEICHITAWRYAQDPGHGSGWEMAMKLMGAKPDRYYTGNSLPPWVEGYRDAAEQMKKELSAQGADLGDSGEEEGDMA